MSICENLYGATHCCAPERDLKTCLQNLLFPHIVDKRLASVAALFCYSDKIVLCRTDRVRIHVIEQVLAEPSDLRGAFVVTEEDLKLLNRGLGSAKRNAAWVFHLEQPLPIWEQRTENDVVRVPLEKSDELNWLQRIGVYREQASARMVLHSSKDLTSALKENPGVLTIQCGDNQDVEVWLVGDKQMLLPLQITAEISEAVTVSMQSRYILKWLPAHDEQIEVLLTGTRAPVRWSWGTHRLWLMPMIMDPDKVQNS